MKRSLRRALAVRFAATMAAGLAATSAAVLAAERLDVALIAVVVLGAAATLVGAWHFAGSAVRPVAEITEQATRIEAGTLDQRIAAHADVLEYEGLVAVLNRMLERLERAFAAQRRLTADVSHELRTPLTVLRGEIEIALRADRSQREYQMVLRSALEEIDRLTEMSDDLLLVTRAESGLIQPRRAVTDLNHLVRHVVGDLHHRLEENGLTVSQELDPAADRVSVDPGLLSRLVAHLLDNAVRFSPPGRRVGVGTGVAGGRVRLWIEDSGPGIAAQDLPHVFEPFFRADPARSSGSGMGLGLSVAAAIARLHGGAIRARNLNGAGARFEVELPVSSEVEHTLTKH